MDKSQLKTALLVTARSFGLFALARRLTRGQLRILAYHGAALSDEADFRGGLFMTKDTFESRLAFLAKHGYPVLKLEDALAQLDSGKLPPCATVITIDDGWLGTRTIMAPALAKYGFASMLYFSSYYMHTQTQVCNVAAAYVLWKSGKKTLDLHSLSHDLTGEFQLDDPEDRERASVLLHKYTDALDGSNARQAFLEKLCKAVDVDITPLVKHRLFTYMTTEEAKELEQFGMDVQLHTHRHIFPHTSIEAARREIEDNRKALEPVASMPLSHFCFPSGDYQQKQLPWLRQMNIATSTTTQVRFNRRGCDVLQLGRFLDAEKVDELEFDAEMSGFYELLRILGIR